MDQLCLMVTVVTRNLGEKYLNFYLENQIEVQLVTLGRGTVNDETLDYFGLESHDKAVLFSVVTKQLWQAMQRGLHRKMQIDVPGTGVAFTIPLASIGGRGVFTYLTKNLDFQSLPEPGKQTAEQHTKKLSSENMSGRETRGKQKPDHGNGIRERADGKTGQEEKQLQDLNYEMIVAVANQGYTEPIMEAARTAGAGGGTVIHAKGTGMEGMGKFFGVSLAAEKEMIFIVTRKEQKNEIMRAIMEKAGMESKARTFLFSLPVSGVAGLNLEPDEEE